ncbi:hypothetical protein GMI69_05980 [Eggerthellaceae bacterium zg-887]|uniref:hypothetical protein n=1 Tax=Xiamenia xianingshaonis TaxID=2682776 RepID=UPI001409734E|nr:hypothetical protein [Xiamenia xianingshaonis]NHM16207.1 hypothetical protein [Xiamenia xianingshaonis]
MSEETSPSGNTSPEAFPQTPAEAPASSDDQNLALSASPVEDAAPAASVPAQPAQAAGPAAAAAQPSPTFRQTQQTPRFAEPQPASASQADPVASPSQPAQAAPAHATFNFSTASQTPPQQAYATPHVYAPTTPTQPSAHFTPPAQPQPQPQSGATTPASGDAKKRPWLYALVGGAAGLLIGAVCASGCTMLALHAGYGPQQGAMGPGYYDQNGRAPYGNERGYDYDDRYDYGDRYGDDWFYDDDYYGHDYGDRSYNHDDYGYGYNGGGNNGNGSEGNSDRGGQNSGGSSTGASQNALTFDEIEDMLGITPGPAQNGKYEPGAYVVGANETLKPGLYFLEGTQGKESKFIVFDQTGQRSGMPLYEAETSCVYVGSYFVNLEEGDVFAYMPVDRESRFFDASQAVLDKDAPYESGLYRVGTDIPAGTYTITVAPGTVEGATQENAAYVMKDLEFDDDSIVDTKYVIAGSSQTVELTDGQWLELYGAIATPAK